MSTRLTSTRLTSTTLHLNNTSTELTHFVTNLCDISLAQGKKTKQTNRKWKVDRYRSNDCRHIKEAIKDQTMNYKELTTPDHTERNVAIQYTNRNLLSGRIHVGKRILRFI